MNKVGEFFLVFIMIFSAMIYVTFALVCLVSGIYGDIIIGIIGMVMVAGVLTLMYMQLEDE